MKQEANLLEEGTSEMLDFTKLSQIAGQDLDVLPVVVQDVFTKEVLILAYANREALEYSTKHGIAAFWSTSRNELWIKGKGSGDTLELVEIRVNCEQNSLLYLVHPSTGGACHTRDATGMSRPGCYYRRLLPSGKLEFL